MSVVRDVPYYDRMFQREILEDVLRQPRKRRETSPLFFLPFFHSFLFRFFFISLPFPATRVAAVRGSTRHVNCFLRCYNKTHFFPDTVYSVWCSTNSTLHGQDGIRFVVACCDHSDYCNRDLRPFFPPHESRGRPYSRFANHLERGTINRG